MKPYYAKVTSEFDDSIIIRYDEMPFFYKHWHYHDDYELVYVHKSSGIRHVGDNITIFKEGDLVLLGSRLPHIWLNNTEHNKDGSEVKAAATIIHIQKRFVQNGFFDLPSMKMLKELFLNSQRGICFKKFNNIEKIIKSLEPTRGANRVIATLDLFSKLSVHPDQEFLASPNYIQIKNIQNHDRLMKVYEYIAKNFREEITLNDLAEIAHMTPQAFCSFFKKKTGKTIFTYINDLKIGYSCKMLMETGLNISQIASESGFNSVTFFNRKFRKQMNVTPKEYRNKFKEW